MGRLPPDIGTRGGGDVDGGHGGSLRRSVSRSRLCLCSANSVLKIHPVLLSPFILAPPLAWQSVLTSRPRAELGGEEGL